MKQPVWADADVVRYVVRVSVWARWFLWVAAVFQLVYRPGFWYPDDVEYLYLYAVLAALNAVVHYRLVATGTVTWRWMLALSTMDVVLITGGVVIAGEFDSFVFLAYYPALLGFAIVFSSLWFGMAFATAAAVSYWAASSTADAGLDLDAGDEKVLVARVVVMYAVVVVVSVVLRFERRGRQEALSRERQVQQERLELSQAIHDTVAQTAYMIGLGIDGAAKLAGDSNPKLAERLAATSDLAKSAMWELRRPIGSGPLLEGSALGRVLGSHTATFGKITSVRAEMVQTGEEPPLDSEIRSRLFSIAHNALANAFLHARASSVEVRLDFEADRVRLCVCDDGIGLPADHAERGRGFVGMNADAQRIGGTLTVEPGGPNGGTTVTCMVPRARGETGG